MKKTLFFGKKGDPVSQDVYRHLCEHGFEVAPLWSVSRDEKIPAEIMEWGGDYIFCFRSYFILPERLINKAEVAAINFHPAPPEYPGSGCINWALYENSPLYGVTAHIMTSKVDNGPILKVERFPILETDTLGSLLYKTHRKTLNVFYDVVAEIVQKGSQAVADMIEENAHESWKGKARRMHEIDHLQALDHGVSKAEMERVIRATSFGSFQPFIELHGRRFYMKPE